MKNSYLINVLESFSKKEVKEFKKWLSSPAHNQREDIEDLFSYLMASNHIKEEKYLQKERIFKKIFPKQTYDDARLRQTMHFLTKAMEEFLVFKSANSDDIDFNLTLASIYRKRNLDKAFQKTVNNTQVKREKSSIKNADFFWDEFKLQTELYSFWSSRNKRQSTFNFQEISDALDISYIANKMKYLCIMMAQSIVIKTDYEIDFVDEVIAQIEKKQLHEIPTIGIYYYVYKAIICPNEEVFYNRLKAQIQSNHDIFPTHELNYIVRLALNYCIARINEGKGQFRREAFELQKMWIEKDLFLAENMIDPHVFRNIVTGGCLQREFKWVTNLIEHYQKYLPSNQREKVAHFCEAILNFIKGDYEKASELLVNFNYDDIILTAQAKSMLIRLYYEQDEYDLLDAQLESTRTYLHRKKNMGRKRDQWMNFIRYTKKLVKINPYNSDHKKKLKEEIFEAVPFPGKDWLLKQIAAL